MKITVCYWAVALCLLLACQRGASNNDTKNADTITHSLPQDTSAMDLKEAQRTLEWSDVNTAFLKDCLNPFLETKHITPSCSGCDRFHFTFSFTIDTSGKIISITKDSEDVRCKLSDQDKKTLDELIITYMKKQTLPESFHGSTYKGKLGFILKC